MKKFGFFFSVIIGILGAWMLFDVLLKFSLNFSFGLSLVLSFTLSCLLSGFLTSLLISKDALPPAFILKRSAFVKASNSSLDNRAGSGVFSTWFFLFFKITYLFMVMSSGFGDDWILFIGLYVVFILISYIWAFLLGSIGGGYGINVRDALFN